MQCNAMQCFLSPSADLLQQGSSQCAAIDTHYQDFSWHDESVAQGPAKGNTRTDLPRLFLNKPYLVGVGHVRCGTARGLDEQFAVEGER